MSDHPRIRAHTDFFEIGKYVPEWSARKATVALQCKAEIANFCPESRVNQNVFALQVPVLNAWSRGVQESETLSDITNDLKNDFSSSVHGLIAQ